MAIKGLVVIFFMCLSIYIDANPYDLRSHTVHPQVGRFGMVVTTEKLASEIGISILKKGGNAVDAAIAIGYALAVTTPRAGNIGGGGFMLIYLAQQGKVVALDYRETASASASSDLLLDEKGDYSYKRIKHHILATGVPGTVAGLELARQKYGTMSRRDLMLPAVELANKGFSVNALLAQELRDRKNDMQQFPETYKVFFPDNKLLKEGDIFFQKDLAWSLDLIMRKGRGAFYEGEIADRIVDYMVKKNGVISREDLKEYRPIIRQPVRGTYRGYDVFSMPPPSSGGVHLIQMLNILENFPLSQLGFQTSESLHIIAETMKFAYADRSMYLGDPDFYQVPISSLISKEYAALLSNSISLKRVVPSEEVGPGLDRMPEESDETTHYSVVDKWGNCVSNTYTLNASYGSMRVVPGTGILLNNELDDFAAKPNVANAFGLVGSEANKVEPKKRPLSSMTPTFIFSEGKPFLVLGGAGGSRIITSVLQTVINVIDYNLNISEAAFSKRIHHQWRPDRLYVEQNFNKDVLRSLTQKGHVVSSPEQSQYLGRLNNIMIKNGYYYGAASSRIPFTKAASY